jgi:hypothetical protein
MRLLARLFVVTTGKSFQSQVSYAGGVRTAGSCFASLAPRNDKGSGQDRGLNKTLTYIPISAIIEICSRAAKQISRK